MKQLTAFTKKEFTELVRSGKMLILLIVFVLFGVMNPAIAKLTPWMMDVLSDSLAKAGMSVGNIKVDALTSWTQFYKNIPIAMIIFVVMFSGIMASEYQKGTLINMLTKGLARRKVIAAKAAAAVISWTFCYALCFGISYGYTVYFWRSDGVQNVFAGALCLYLFGLWLISLIFLTSALFDSVTSVLAGVGGIFAAVYVLGLLPAVQEYLPVRLLSSSGLLTGAAGSGDFGIAALVTGLTMILAYLGAVVLFNRKNV